MFIDFNKVKTENKLNFLGLSVKFEIKLVSINNVNFIHVNDKVTKPRGIIKVVYIKINECVGKKTHSMMNVRQWK